MKGKINEDGFLLIERGSEYVKQYCPFNVYNYCGHHCPLFSEPKINFTCKHDNMTRGRIQKTTWVILRICNSKELFFKEFYDERVKL